MGQKLVVGPIDRGIRTDRLPFNIDNDSFPVLLNAYQWRGRIKRKRGTQALGRLTIVESTKSIGNSGSSPWSFNIYSVYGITPETNASIVPGSVVITIQNSPDIVFTDQGNGTLTSPTMGNSGTINYISGDIVLTTTAMSGTASTATFDYYPDLPVMGLEELILGGTSIPGTLAFDTTYSYNITTASPYSIYNTNFYKNPPTGTPPTYTHKPADTPTTWNGADYQQFWTVNFQGALWATNGVPYPFSISNLGMQFAPASTISGTTWDSSTTVSFTITNCPLIIGDFVFLNEWTAGTAANAEGINFQTGYVTACSPNTTPLATKTLTVTFPYANITSDTYTPGIIQYLTNRSDTTKDCLRWYDGDPTISNNGWVNFCPPLSLSITTISDLPAKQYYLIGAKMIVPFKDRLLFIGPVVQSSTGSPAYLQDTIIYSQNGTPYYTASFSGNPSLANTVFNQLLVPNNQTATPNAYWADQTGYGGNITIGVDQRINTVGANEDVLIMGLDRLQVRCIYTGSDFIPFTFYIINAELGSSATFSSIILDEGVITKGTRGFVITSQNECRRIDLDIPDKVFQINVVNHGNERMSSQRDFINEWIYFTYSSNDETSDFPDQTLLYNYRDQSWAIFNESYTTYGTFRISSGETWGTLDPSITWGSWDSPWNSGEQTVGQPLVIAGNQQGFVVFRNTVETSEAPSLYIQSFSGNTITSPDHTLNNDDYIYITGCLGTIGTQVNNKVFKVSNVTENTFIINTTITSATYLGAGVITRLYMPFIQTKQFPVAWNDARKTRIGVQQYLLTTTANNQITLLIFLSQNQSSPYNLGPIVPAHGSTNDSLIYSTVLYTCPESTNLGLTPANINLQMVTAAQQSQTWHRINTSLIGDSIQLAFTLSDDQMSTVTDSGALTNQIAEIELHGFIIDVTPSMVIA